MNIKEIRYFIEVVEMESFTKASENLYISQPALSKSIKNLESKVKKQLIERSTKTFELTYEGKIFYENAKKSVNIIDDELEKLEQTFNICKDSFVLGLPPGIGGACFTSVISKFKKDNKDVDIRIVEEGANSVKCKVENEEIDIGVVLLPLREKKFTTIPITSSEIVIVVSTDNPLSNKSLITFNELEDEKIISFNDNFMMFNKTMNMCNKYGFNPNIAIKTSQLEFMVEMVSLNEGVAIMPRPVVERFRTNDIKLIDISDSEFIWEIGFIVKKDKYMSKILKLFIDCTVNCYQ